MESDKPVEKIKKEWTLEEIKALEKPPAHYDGPFKIDLVPGKKYSWCSCGLSKIEPLCDHMHKGSKFKPVKFYAKEGETSAYLCGCKQTKTPPYCDGSHKCFEW